MHTATQKYDPQGVLQALVAALGHGEVTRTEGRPRRRRTKLITERSETAKQYDELRVALKAKGSLVVSEVAALLDVSSTAATYHMRRMCRDAPHILEEEPFRRDWRLRLWLDAQTLAKARETAKAASQTAKVAKGKRAAAN